MTINRKLALLGILAIPALTALSAAPLPTAKDQPAAKPAAPSAPVAGAVQPAGDVARGRALFGSSSCGDCHGLADAGAAGIVGPSLDQNPNVTREMLLTRMKDGQGAMPAMSGQLSDEDMADIAAYVLKVAAR